MYLHKVIVDEDWGGDTMQVVAVLRAHPQDVTLIGATTVFGNTGHEQVLKNAGELLQFLHADHVPYFSGAALPRNDRLRDGDGAHGEDGIGGVVLPSALVKPEAATAVEFILNSLKSEPLHTVTIIAAAPQTNIAQAWARDPEVMMRAKQIIIMGGCTAAMKANDMSERQGNITPGAEFNFYMAAADARTVMTSGIPIVLFPMNCTHQMTFTPAREEKIRWALGKNREVAERVIGMMRAATEIDAHKFGISAVMHDVHTALYLLHPKLYQGRRGHVDVTVGGPANGHTDFRPDECGQVLVMETIKNPDRLFDCVVKSLQLCFAANMVPRVTSTPRL